MTEQSPQAGTPTIAETFAARLASLTLDDIPAKARETAINDLLDMAGLCIAARNTDYVHALIEGWDGEGNCTALGHPKGMDAPGAALVNGTSTHGEDFDDTLEGTPIRVGAMVIPAVLAAAERFGRTGADALLGITLGLETVCRLNQVAPGAMHKACFHPVGVIGVFGGAAGAGAALGLNAGQMTNAVAISSSLASGILEYLTDGAWTKRLHPGWAAHSGLRAALFARAGYNGPRTVFEGGHNYFRAFAPSATPRYGAITEGLGEEWLMEGIAFKPYACGTMIHPFIDCTIRLAAEGVDGDDIADIECETGEGLVDRLWEPLADKHKPPTGYAAKFSMPFCMAVGFFDGDAGLDQFSDEKAKDPRILALASKIRYVIDPDNEYPVNYSGHIKVTMKDGSVRELRQPHFRGGVREPLTRDQLIDKFRANVAYGGLGAAFADRLLDFCVNIESRKDLGELASFRV